MTEQPLQSQTPAGPTEVPPTIEEARAEAAPTSPVLPADASGGATPPRHRRLRWAVALAVVALAVGTSVAAAALLTGASAPSTVAKWAPPDAVAFGEVRADLPGDQRQALGSFLSAFPGFADQSILDRKLDEVYQRLIAAATEGRQSWSADIAPWFGGQVGVAVGLPPTGSGGIGSGTGELRDGRMLAIATTTDAAKAIAWVRTTADQKGLTVTTSQHAGSDVLLMGPTDHRKAAAATGDVLLVGDQASVEAALDRAGQGGLATVATYRDATAALPADRLMTAYVDPAAVVAAMGSMPGASTSAGLDAIAGMTPAWAASSLRVESDALVGDGVAPRTAASPDTANAASQLPSRLPATTVALFDAHDAGAVLIARAGSAGAAEKDQLEKALAPVGGLKGLLGWVGEAGIVVLGGDEAQPGLVAIPTDAAAAQGFATTVKNLASVAGLSPTKTDHGGTTIVTIDLSKLTARDGIPAPSGGYSSVSYAVTQDLVVVGFDPAFVASVLDTKAGASLADQARFKDLVDRAGAKHRAVAWIDLVAATKLATARMDAAERARFDKDVAPYLTPFDVAVGVVTRDGDLDRTHGLVVLREGR